MKKIALVNEWKTIFQIKKYMFSRFPLPKKEIRGNGEKIILIPGWKTGDKVMSPLKKYLQKTGYNADSWGLGVNNGNVEKYRDELILKIKKDYAKDKVTLIGWSLGGLVARETARLIQDKVTNIITFGTPIVGGPRYTIGSGSMDEHEIKRIENLTKELDKSNPIAIPICAIFTKNDNFVSWPACIDKINKQTKHYEVTSTHTGLGINHDVFSIIVQNLFENLNNRE